MNQEWAVKEFMPLIRKLAYDLARSLPPSVSVEDLIQEGVIGLLRSLERFDPTKKVKISTYVTSRIKGSMLDYLRSIDWMPRGLRKKMKDIEKVRLSLLNQDINQDEMRVRIAEELEMEVRDVEIVEREITRDQILSLDNYLFSQDELIDSIASDERTPQEFFEDEETVAKLRAIIESLTEREQMLLSLYYEQELTFKEIADILEISESRVCQIHSAALSKVKKRVKGMN